MGSVHLSGNNLWNDCVSSPPNKMKLCKSKKDGVATKGI